MKLYQIIMKVPDDFVPEEMQLTASCKDEVEICSECFIGPERMIDVADQEPEVTDEWDPLSEGDSEKGDSESEQLVVSENEGEEADNSEEESKEGAENEEKDN